MGALDSAGPEFGIGGNGAGSFTAGLGVLAGVGDGAFPTGGSVCAITVMGSFAGALTGCAGLGFACAFVFGSGLTGGLAGVSVAGAGETSGSGVGFGSGTTEAV